MRWKINDEGLTGPIDFDMRIENVRTLLGEPNDSFRRTPDSDDLIVAYDEAGIQLNINDEGLLTQLTIFPDNEVFIGKIQLINKPINSIYTELQAIGVAVDHEDAGLWCEAQKVFLVDVGGVVDGIEIYRRANSGDTILNY